MDVTIIADDLTGACDTGALFTGRGPVSVLVAPELPDADLEVATIDTETRGLPVAEAAAAMRGLSQALKPRLVTGTSFKKIDSTFRGSIAAELEALVEGARARAALVCPAFPAMGRTVVHGLLAVHGVAVHESPIGLDPDFPHVCSDLVEILGRHCRLPVSLLPLKEVRGALGDLERAVRERRGLVVVDAEADGDLRALAMAALEQRDVLLAGSAGLARAAAMAWGHASPAVSLPEASACLIVAGSRHPATRAQIDALEAAGVGGARIQKGREPDPSRILGEMKQGRSAFVSSGDAPDGTREQMAARLAALARAVINGAAPSLLVLTGGDTALAVLRALGGRLELDGAPASGLALGRLIAGGRSPLTVLTKAGGFGAPDLLASIVKGAN
jgi:uncharacterized protein YgbK (DUF1537 family)